MGIMVVGRNKANQVLYLILGLNKGGILAWTHKFNECRDMVVYVNRDSPVVYLMSDIHFDHPDCDLNLFKKHLEMAKEEGAQICIFGDLFDAMQSRRDPRARRSELLTRLKEDGYLNELIKMAVEILEPYKDNILLLGYGNHEISLIKNLDFDIIREVGERLSVPIGGYEGFITFIISPKDNSQSRFSKVMFYTHGRNSSAEITMGLLTHKRIDIWMRNVDILVMGHLHTHFIYEQKTLSISPRNHRLYSTVYHIQLPTYKERGEVTGFTVEKLMPPSPKGCVRMEFIIKHKNDKNGVNIKVERVA